MDEEQFNGEYFQHLLASLTLNSRALIVELTGIAERYTEDAGFMVDMIEERINKILPKYKLYSFYLMDLIIKNVGNPYNLLFAKNIFKLFTETYLIVDDTTTRQNLINLFKTWMTGKTSAGLELFPHEVLLRIEKFIIRATSLGLALGAHQDGAQPHVVRITRDAILREANYLLQYIIAIDEDLENIVTHAETQDKSDKGKLRYVLDSQKVHELRLKRNKTIFEINGISESVMCERKDEFEVRKEKNMHRLQEIRKLLDLQSEEQTKMRQGLSTAPLRIPENTQVAPKLQQPRSLNIDLVWGEDEAFHAYVEAWGRSSIQTAALFGDEAPDIYGDQAQPVQEKAESEVGVLPNPSELASSLGINIESFNFDEYNSSVSTTDKDLGLDDDDGYDPESTIIEEKHSPPTSPIHGGSFQGKSSLKRPISGESKSVKRVRFEI